MAARREWNEALLCGLAAIWTWCRGWWVRSRWHLCSWFVCADVCDCCPTWCDRQRQAEIGALPHCHGEVQSGRAWMRSFDKFPSFTFSALYACVFVCTRAYVYVGACQLACSLVFGRVNETPSFRPYVRVMSVSAVIINRSADHRDTNPHITRQTCASSRAYLGNSRRYEFIFLLTKCSTI